MHCCKSRTIFIFYFCLILHFQGFTKDYKDYHKSIIAIEEQMFVEDRIKDGLNGYLKLFKEYDFVFLQDCVTAMQMALYAKNETAFLAFVDKATKNGLIPRHLKNIAYINDNELYKRNADTIAKLYIKNRPLYLNRIDTAVLKSVYNICAFDQFDKNRKAGESREAYQYRYKSVLQTEISKLKAIMDMKGWIGDKLIGVDQNDIIKELHVNSIDYHQYYYKYKEEAINNSPSQFVLNEMAFASTLITGVILHYGMFEGEYNMKRNLLYSDSFYLNQILLGNMHPKEIAFFYDQPYSVVRGSKPDIINGEKYFGVGIRIKEAQNNSLIIPDEEINRFRKDFFIAPINNDRAKWAFFKKNGMYIGWGFHSMRS